MVAIPIQTLSNATYAVVREVEPGLFHACAQSDLRLHAYGRTADEAIAKLRRRIDAAEDCAA